MSRQPSVQERVAEAKRLVEAIRVSAETSGSDAAQSPGTNAGMTHSDSQNSQLVTEDDLDAMAMPKLQARRFLVSASEIPQPAARPLRAANTIAMLLDRAQQLAALPSAQSTYQDPEALGRAVVDLSSAAHAVQSKALEPSQWLEDFRLEHFSVNFDALGVEMLVDFTEVTEADLETMAMAPLQKRRFRRSCAEIPNPGGPQGQAQTAMQRCAECPRSEVVHEWLRALRLSAWAAPMVECGVRALPDFVEVLDEELHLMGLPQLQRRRYFAAATLAAGHSTPESAVRAMAEAAAEAADVADWLRLLRLDEYQAALLPAAGSSGGLGVEDPYDFREIMLSDLDALAMPPIQQRRFLAAVRLIPEPPEPVGRRWEAPQKWLESLRLGRFWPLLQTLGVDRVGDFAEVLDSDLNDIQMGNLFQRRFRAAIAKDTMPSAAGPGAGAGAIIAAAGDDPVTAGAASMAALKSAGVDVLAMQPSRWLSALRCEAFMENFERLGVEKVVDFAEVLVDDLLDMRLPLLHRRRFAQAAADAEAAQAAQRSAAGPRYPAGLSAASPGEWLTEMRLERFGSTFQRLGVEQVVDFAEVLHSDLVAMGMPPLQMRRFLRAVSKAGAGGAGGALALADGY